MHELCGICADIYDSFHRKQTLFWERDPKKFAYSIMVWHLLQGITLLTIWTKCNDWVFNQEQWHESKMKQVIWDDLIVYTKVAWARVVKLIEISIYSTELLKGIDDSWGARNVLCKQNQVQSSWN